jgi:AcrR family transcriptional regulator
MVDRSSRPLPARGAPIAGWSAIIRLRWRRRWGATPHRRLCGLARLHGGSRDSHLAHIGHRHPVTAGWPGTADRPRSPQTIRTEPKNHCLPGVSPAHVRFLPLCPRQDSNLRSRLRRAVLYPLSYGGSGLGEFSVRVGGRWGGDDLGYCGGRKVAGCAGFGVGCVVMEGLRERKKRETRAALSWAALRLAVERGFDNVLVEDIAGEAGVSARTFNNYFASKAEAICSRHVDRMRGVVEELRRRPGGESVWEALTAAALGWFDGEGRAPDPEWTAGVRLVLSEPAILGEFLRASAVVERELTEAIAERTGTDPMRDLYPRLVAAVFGAAVNTANRAWLDAEPPVAPGVVLREALGQLAAGLPTP